jgi:hypothetical protein
MRWLRFLRSLFGTGHRDRVVFPYHDGTQDVYADPLRIKAALDAALPTWAAFADELLQLDRVKGLDMGPKLAAERERKADQITADLVKCVRKAFGIEEYKSVGRKESGKTDLECLELLGDYVVWVSEVMEDTRPLASSPPCTDSAASPSRPENVSGSPSTPTGSSESEPSPRPALYVAPCETPKVE